MFSVDPAALHQALEQLQRAQHDHAAWHENLIGTLLCRLPANPADLEENAHRRCHFGQWYYSQAPAALREQPAFSAIDADHKQVHDIAMQLLREAASGGPIALADYDSLVACSARLNLELDSLRHEVQAALRGSDPLTGAYDRSQLLPELNEWRELARRGIQHCCIAFMDLDRFKQINDRFGHSVGDQVLAGAVHCVVEKLRSYDKVFRYGGDEFLISMPAADLATGQVMAERVGRVLRTTPLVASAEGTPIFAVASFGLALLDPDVSVEESIDRADTALLAAKAAGRGRAVCWNPAINTHHALRTLREEDISG